MQALAMQLPTLVFLADANGVPVSQSWGAAEDQDDVPTPATFVVDPAGRILFAHYSGRGDGEWPDFRRIQAVLPAAQHE